MSSIGETLPTGSEAEAAAAATAMKAMMDQLVQLVSDARLTNVLLTVAISLLLYDYIISLREEIELIWRRKMRFTSYLYIWNRYASIVGIVAAASFVLREIKDDAACLRYLQMEGAFASMITSTVDVVLVYRIWILYSKSKPLLYFLSFLVLAECVIINSLVITTLNSIESFIHIGPILTGCYPSEPLPGYFKFYVVTMLVVALIMFLLTVHSTAVLLFRYKWRGMPIIRLFLRDGLFWFVGVLAFTVAQAVVLTMMRVTLAEMMIAPTVAVYGTIGSRVVLNIRGVLLKPDHHTDYGADDVATIEMAKVSHMRIRTGHRHPSSLSDDEDDEIVADQADSVGTKVDPVGLERGGTVRSKRAPSDMERVELDEQQQQQPVFGFGLGRGYGEAPIVFGEPEVPKRMGGLGRKTSQRDDGGDMA